MLGFKSSTSAATILSGIESFNSIRTFPSQIKFRFDNFKTAAAFRSALVANYGIGQGTRQPVTRLAICVIQESRSIGIGGIPVR